MLLLLLPQYQASWDRFYVAIERCSDEVFAAAHSIPTRRTIRMLGGMARVGLRPTANELLARY